MTVERAIKAMVCDECGRVAAIVWEDRLLCAKHGVERLEEQREPEAKPSPNRTSHES